MNAPVFLSMLLASACILTNAKAAELSFFVCGEVQFFVPACTLVEVAPAQQPPAPPAKAPLFTPVTMAPDTPPLLLKLLEEPTASNAHAFLEWQAERAARITEVQHLLRTLTKKGAQP